MGDTDGVNVPSVSPLRRTWKDSDRFVPRVVVRPALEFARVEAAGGIVMLLGAAVALVWANSPWDAAYRSLWSTPVWFRIGGNVGIDTDLHGLVNDALMSLFFLVAGLEIKRQVTVGELRDRQAAALPALAALGGMVAPALIYLSVNQGHVGSKGWGIPVATDIAFAVGVVTLAGSRVPLGARIFILTLAVVDDIGGIVVIAVFYATDVRLAWLAVAAGSVALTVLVRRAEIRSLVPYLVLGVLCWYALHHAGVESAITGVIFGLLTPVDPFHDPREFGDVAHALVDRIETSDEVAAEDLARYARETASPLERIEGRLNYTVSFAIVPVFALANAGVRFAGTDLNHRVAGGIIVGLVAGKTIGVFGFAWLAVRLGIGRLSAGVTWRHMLGLAATAGIGFTVALFVTGLSFTDPGLVASAKVGVLVASAIAGLVGWALLRTSPPTD
jgi:NhaA family Na+:H+ antiporter